MQRRSLSFAMLFAAALIACDSPSKVELPTTPSAPAPAPLVNISGVSVTGSSSLTGGTTQYAATMTMAGGVTLAVTDTASWQSSNPSVVTVTNTGLVTAVGTGTADVSATFQGSTGKLTVLVNLFG